MGNSVKGLPSDNASKDSFGNLLIDFQEISLPKVDPPTPTGEPDAWHVLENVTPMVQHNTINVQQQQGFSYHDPVKEFQQSLANGAHTCLEVFMGMDVPEPHFWLPVNRNWDGYLSRELFHTVCCLLALVFAYFCL